MPPLSIEHLYISPGIISLAAMGCRLALIRCRKLLRLNVLPAVGFAATDSSITKKTTKARSLFFE